MELRASISVSVLASRELAEVAGGYWDNFVIELEYDTAFIFVVNCNIELVDCDGKSANIPYLAVEGKRHHSTRWNSYTVERVLT